MALKVFEDVDIKGGATLNGNILPQQNLSQNIGSTEKTFANIYANRFHGTASTAQNYDTTTGGIKDKFDSIDMRLNSLGFSSGTISFGGVTYGSTSYTDTSQNGIYRMGNFVFCRLVIDGSENTNRTFGNLAADFRPKTTTYFTVFATKTDLMESAACLYSISPDGTITEVESCGSTSEWAVYGMEKFYITFGYEVLPRTSIVTTITNISATSGARRSYFIYVDTTQGSFSSTATYRIFKRSSNIDIDLGTFSGSTLVTYGAFEVTSDLKQSANLRNGDTIVFNFVA